jgi:hypothetical protein
MLPSFCRQIPRRKSTASLYVAPFHDEGRVQVGRVRADRAGEGQGGRLALVILDIPDMKFGNGLDHLSEEEACRLVQQVAQHVQAPTVWHAHLRQTTPESRSLGDLQEVAAPSIERYTDRWV